MHRYRFVWLIALAALPCGCASPYAFDRWTPPSGPGAEQLVLLDVPVVKQDAPTRCGAACLEAVGRYWMRPWRQDEIARELGIRDEPPTGAGILAMRDWVRRQDVAAYAFAGTVDRLIEQLERGRPVVVALELLQPTANPSTWRRPELKHFVVVVGHHPAEGYLVCIDPRHGLVSAPVQRFDRHWSACDRAMLVIAPLKDNDPDPKRIQVQ